MARTKVDHDHEFFAASARKYATTVVRTSARRDRERDVSWIDVYMRRYRTLTGRPIIAGPIPVRAPARKARQAKASARLTEAEKAMSDIRRGNGGAR